MLLADDSIDLIDSEHSRPRKAYYPRETLNDISRGMLTMP